MTHAKEHQIEKVVSKSIAGNPDNDQVQCSCGQWEGVRHMHKTHVADSRPKSSLPSDTIEALGACQYSAAWFLQVVDDVQASGAPIECPERLTERLNEMRTNHARFLCVRDGKEFTRENAEQARAGIQVGDYAAEIIGNTCTEPSQLPLIHDLTVRSIAHSIEAEHPKSDEEAMAFARRAALALDFTADGVELAATGAVRAWHEMYDAELIYEGTLSHPEFARAARIMLLRGDPESHGIASTYMLMALYEALLAGHGGR